MTLTLAYFIFIPLIRFFSFHSVCAFDSLRIFFLFRPVYCAFLSCHSQVSFLHIAFAAATAVAVVSLEYFYSYCCILFKFHFFFLHFLYVFILLFTCSLPSIFTLHSTMSNRFTHIRTSGHLRDEKESCRSYFLTGD